MRQVAGVGASTEWLGVGITCRGGGGSAKGKEGWTWGWMRVEWWLVCESPAYADKVYHAKYCSWLIDCTETRSTIFKMLDDPSDGARRAARGALAWALRLSGTRATKRPSYLQGWNEPLDASCACRNTVHSVHAGDLLDPTGLHFLVK